MMRLITLLAATALGGAAAAQTPTAPPKPPAVTASSPSLDPHSLPKPTKDLADIVSAFGRGLQLLCLPDQRGKPLPDAATLQKYAITRGSPNAFMVPEHGFAIYGDIANPVRITQLQGPGKDHKCEMYVDGAAHGDPVIPYLAAALDHWALTQNPPLRLFEEGKLIGSGDGAAKRWYWQVAVDGKLRNLVMITPTPAASVPLPITVFYREVPTQ